MRVYGRFTHCQTTSAGEIKGVYRGLLEVLKQAAQTAEGYTEIHSRITSPYLPSWVLKTSEMFNDLQQAISQPRCLSVRVLHDKEYLPAGLGLEPAGIMRNSLKWNSLEVLQRLSGARLILWPSEGRNFFDPDDF